MPIANWMQSLAASGVVLACVACQSSEIAQVQQARPLTPFRSAVVETFDTSATTWVGDHGEHTPAEVSAALREEICTRLAGGGIPVVDSESADAVVIRGAIDLVDAGSGATRALVGLGAGQSKLTCRSWILQPGSADPAVTLTVVGGSRGRGGLFGSGYLTIGDARDAGEQIAQFLLKARAQ